MAIRIISGGQIRVTTPGPQVVRVAAALLTGVPGPAGPVGPEGPEGPTGGVASVAGRTGAVTLSIVDVADLPDALGSRMSYGDAAELEATAPGFLWSRSDADGNLAFGVTVDGVTITPGDAASLETVTVTAGGTDHCGLIPPWEGGRTADGWLPQRAAVPIRITANPGFRPTGRAQYVRHWGRGAVIVAGATGEPAVYPLPVGAVMATAEPSIVALLPELGQSLSLGDVSGPALGRPTTETAWTAAQLYAAPVSDRVLMPNGGIYRPGQTSIDGVPSSTAFASLVPALDIPGGAQVPITNAEGTVVGQGYDFHQTGAVVGGDVIVNGADGYAGSVYGVLLRPGLGGRSILFFLPAAYGGTSNWWDNVWVTHLTRFAAAVAAMGKTAHVPYITWNQGEEDKDAMTATTYRGHLDNLGLALDAAVASACPASPAPVIVQSQQALWWSANTFGEPTNTLAGVPQAVLAKGISSAAADARYVCAGPNYDLAYTGGFHMTPTSYVLAASRRGRIVNHDRWKRSVGLGKFLPTHATGARLETIAGRSSVVLPYHAEFYPLRIDTNLVPRRPSLGYRLIGGSNAPTITDVWIRGGCEVVLTLSTAWTGTGRVVGVADTMTSGQGYQTADRAPGAVWVHDDASTNICDSAPWSCTVYGRRLPNWACCQRVTVPD